MNDVPDKIIEQRDARLFRGDVTLWAFGQFVTFRQGFGFASNPVPVYSDEKQIGWASLWFDDDHHTIMASLTIDYHSPERFDAQLGALYVRAGNHSILNYEFIGGMMVINEADIDSVIVDTQPIGNPLLLTE